MAETNRARKFKFREIMKQALAMALFGVGFSVAVNGVGPLFENYVVAPAAQFALGHRGQILLQLLFVLVVIFSGAGLFLLRSAYRRAYAVIEIIVGIGAATYSGNELFSSAAADSQVKAIFAALGGIYIIVRGLDNWQQGAR